MIRSHEERWDRVAAAFAAAHRLVQRGALRGLAASVRLEDEADLLRQARWLLEEGAHVAAAVMVGGALEMHLAALCATHGIEWRSDPVNRADEAGAIAKYNGAVGKARKTRPVPYDAADGEHVEGWTKMRNEAAHKPVELAQAHSRSDVQRMHEGVADFIRRVR